MMTSERTWQQWLARLYNLRRDKSAGYERPHKPVLLLSVLDLLDRGRFKHNEIPLNDDLVKTFRRYFEVVRQRDDKPTIENPYYFLSGDGFWTLGSHGRRRLYQPGGAASPPSMNTLRASPGHFDPGLWKLMENPTSRGHLRDALVARYFPEHRDQLAALTSQPVTLNPLGEPPRGFQLNEEFEQARSGAFRQTVLEIYDYMCAACGLRVRLGDGFSLVDAAHLIPFEVSRDDKPDNGLALCPNHHRAMDRFLIAPCPDRVRKAGVCRVSARLDDRKDSRRELVGLAERPVLEPSETKFTCTPPRGEGDRLTLANPVTDSRRG